MAITEDKDIIQDRGARVRYVREKLLNLTREGFCKNFSLSPQSLKAWELGWGGGLNEDRAKDLVDHLKKLGIQTTIAWLMFGVGQLPSLLSNSDYVCEEDEEHIAKELLLFKELPESTYTIVEDDSMSPFLLPGDYVAGVIVSHPKLAFDQPCIITDDRDKTYVRTLKRGDKENFYHLGSLNHSLHLKEIKNVPIKSAAPVLWIRKRKRYRDNYLES